MMVLLDEGEIDIRRELLFPGEGSTTACKDADDFSVPAAETSSLGGTPGGAGRRAVVAGPLGLSW